MKRILLTIIKWVGIVLLTLIGIFLTIQAWFDFTAPVYTFERPGRFAGEQWYNPYSGMDSTWWRKANFHFHTREWGGITAGGGNTNEEFWQAYKSLGYDAPMISNYQRISEYNKDSGYYLGVYEHGFGVRKKHHILIGSREVLWRDYSLFQNLSHRQHLIDLLKRQNEIVALAHPGWENGYPAHQIGMLSNYDMLEALDGNYRSIPHWDSALSAGRPVWLLADDDAHDLSDPGEIGICITFINAPENTSAELLKALRSGRSYGVDVFREKTETWEEKIRYHALGMPMLHAAVLRHDTLFVNFSDTAMKIAFVGQGGIVKKEEAHAQNAWYLLKPDDTYIRTQAQFYNPKGEPGTILYLNPVLRYDGKQPQNTLTATVNTERTWIFRVMSFGSLALVIAVILRMRKLRTASRKEP